MIDWLFRNRQTGEITIAQMPNAPLIVWAGDEVLRGVNPWRRLLGGGVLAFTLVGLLLR